MELDSTNSPEASQAQLLNLVSLHLARQAKQGGLPLVEVFETRLGPHRQPSHPPTNCGYSINLNNGASLVVPHPGQETLLRRSLLGNQGLRWPANATAVVTTFGIGKADEKIRPATAKDFERAISVLTTPTG